MTQYQAELYHHGIKGQKWGVRRFQNPDGSYTSAGKAHRNSDGNASKNSDHDAKMARAKKIAAVAGAITLAAAAAYVATNPQAREFVANAAKKGVDGIQNSKAINSVKNNNAARQAAGISTNNWKKMSTSELKSAIERLEMEKKYIGLRKETTSAGKAFAKDVITSVGKKTATQLGVSAAMIGAASIASRRNSNKKYIPDAKNQW